MILVINMNKLALWHRAKSEFSYAYNKETLHILLRTGKNDVSSVELIFGDPFEWDGKKGKVYWKHERKIMIKRYQSDDFDYYFLDIKPPFLRTKYAFYIKDFDGKTFLFGSKRVKPVLTDDDLYQVFDLSEYFNFPYLNYEDLHHTPEWVKETVWYQIFPDRFYGHDNKSHLTWGHLPVSNHEIYGGNLKGIISKLPYLCELGITGIYFTPIFLAPTAHKYDTTDYFKIDPQFGTNEDFKALVDEAHRLGIKVMLDGVFNHCGYDHPFFQDVVKNGEKSIYKDAFFIDQFPVVNFPLDQHHRPINYHKVKLNFKTFAFTPHMPKWHTDHPLVKAHLLDVIEYWIKDYGIDGWRLDVSNEISHDFLRDIKKRSRAIKKDTFILGENWDSSIPWLMGDQLDAVMNYDLSYPLWKYLEHSISLSTFKDMVINYLAYTPKHVMENMFNLVGSHDTVRIKRRLKDDPRRVKLSYLFMFLSAGAPNVYYGDEIGLTGEHDPDNRRCMPWDEKEWDLDFLDFTKKIISLRETYDAMSTSDYDFLDLDILAFYKTSDKHKLLVLMNDQNDHIVHLPKDVQKSYINLFTLEKISLHDKISLRPYEFLVLKEA